MLDEAVQGRQGERTDLKPNDDSNLVYNVHEVEQGRPTGNGRAAGLRKLRKHAANSPEIAGCIHCKYCLRGSLSDV